MPTSFDTLPLDVRDDILVHVATERDPICPRSTLGALRLSSRAFFDALSPAAHPRLYALIYMLLFPDAHRIRAITARLDCAPALSVPLAEELQARMRTERVFLDVAASGDVHDPRIPDALRAAYAMLLFDGYNAARLRGARVYDVCRSWVLTRLYEGAETNNGWPRETEANALVVCLFWTLSTRRKLPMRLPSSVRGR